MKTTIAPLLSVRNGAKAVEFYKAAFGAEVLMCVDAPDGAVVAQLSVGGADFWLADESPEHANFSPETLCGWWWLLMIRMPSLRRLWLREPPSSGRSMISLTTGAWGGLPIRLDTIGRSASLCDSGAQWPYGWMVASARYSLPSNKGCFSCFKYLSRKARTKICVRCKL